MPNTVAQQCLFVLRDLKPRRAGTRPELCRTSWRAASKPMVELHSDSYAGHHLIITSARSALQQTPTCDNSVKECSRWTAVLTLHVQMTVYQIVKDDNILAFDSRRARVSPHQKRALPVPTQLEKCWAYLCVRKRSATLTHSDWASQNLIPSPSLSDTTSCTIGLLYRPYFALRRNLHFITLTTWQQI